MTKITMKEEEVAFSEIIGDLVEQWGFNRNLGRIWSFLYLSQKPLNATDVQETLSMSAGAVSASLAELQTWGVVKRIRMAGDRNFYFEAEPQIWKSVGNVFRARELRILGEACSGMQALETRLGKGAKRVKHVREALESATSLVEELISSSRPSLARLNRHFNRLKSL